MRKTALTEALAKAANAEIAKALAQAPAGTDLARSALAQQIIYSDRDPDRWARICRAAQALLARTKNRNERLATLLIEEANGLRRLHHGRTLIRSAKLIAQAWPIVSHLPESVRPRKDRLIELVLYHRAAIFHIFGEYDPASNCHQVIASHTSDPLTRAIANFMAACERLNRWLTDRGGDKVKIKDAIIETGEKLLPLLDRATPLGARWYGNLLCQWRRADWLLNLKGELSQRVPLGEFVIAHPELQNVFADALDLLFAIDISQKNLMQNASESLRIARRIGNSLPTADLGWRSEALLLCAQIQFKTGQRKLTKKTLRQILALTEPGGAVAKAIAKLIVDAQIL